MKSIVTALVDPSGAADYGPDAHVLIWSELPVGAGGTIATDKPLRVPVTASGLATDPIRPGNYLVKIKLSTSRDPLGPYPFTMPDGDGSVDLWALIAAGVNIPADTPIQKIQEALAAYLIANPIDGGGLTVDQIAAAASNPATPLGQTLAQSYAPVAPTATYTYENAPDGSKRIKTETKNGVTMTYVYDDAHDGRISTQSDGTTTWTFNYDTDGLMLGVGA